MSQERIEAAAKAEYPMAWDSNAMPFIAFGESAEESRARVQKMAIESVSAALAAADAVMFSNEAIERAARAIWALHGKKAEDWVYIPPEDNRKAFCMDHARAVIAALKGDA